METLDIYSLLKRSPHDYFKDALALFKDYQFTTALQLLDAAIVFSHNSPFYIYQKIRMLYQMGATQSCNEFILAQLEHLYKQGSLYILCRSLDYLQKISSYNINELRTLLDKHRVPYCLADSYKTLLIQKDKPFFALAEKAMHQDYYELCLAYCNLYLKLHPSNAKICTMQGYCHHMLGNLVLAKKYYIDSIKYEPNSGESYVHIGLILMELGDYSTAIHYLLQATTLEPSRLEYSLYLGECYYVAKKYNEAVATYKQSLTIETNNLQSYFNLLHTYKKMSKNRLSKYYKKRLIKHLKNRV